MPFFSCAQSLPASGSFPVSQKYILSGTSGYAASGLKAFQPINDDL